MNNTSINQFFRDFYQLKQNKFIESCVSQEKMLVSIALKSVKSRQLRYTSMYAFIVAKNSNFFYSAMQNITQN